MTSVPSAYHTIDPFTGNVVELLNAQQYNEMLSIISEQSAELKNDQFWENRGSDEYEQFNQWEESRGVETFADAFARSLGYLDAQDRRNTK